MIEQRTTGLVIVMLTQPAQTGKTTQTTEQTSDSAANTRGFPDPLVSLLLSDHFSLLSSLLSEFFSFSHASMYFFLSSPATLSGNAPATGSTPFITLSNRRFHAARPHSSKNRDTQAKKQI